MWQDTSHPDFSHPDFSHPDISHPWHFPPSTSPARTSPTHISYLSLTEKLKLIHVSKIAPESLLPREKYNANRVNEGITNGCHRSYSDLALFARSLLSKYVCNLIFHQNGLLSKTIYDPSACHCKHISGGLLSLCNNASNPVLSFLIISLSVNKLALVAFLFPFGSSCRVPRRTKTALLFWELETNISEANHSLFYILKGNNPYTYTVWNS